MIRVEYGNSSLPDWEIWESGLMAVADAVSERREFDYFLFGCSTAGYYIELNKTEFNLLKKALWLEEMRGIWELDENGIKELFLTKIRIVDMFGISILLYRKEFENGEFKIFAYTPKDDDGMVELYTRTEV